MKRRNLRPWIFTILGLLLVVLALVGVKGGQIGAMIASGKTFTPPPESVTSALVEGRRVAALPPGHRARWWRSAAADARRRARRHGPRDRLRLGRRGEEGRQVLVRLDTSTEEAQLQAARRRRRAGARSTWSGPAASARAAPTRRPTWTAPRPGRSRPTPRWRRCRPPSPRRPSAPPSTGGSPSARSSSARWSPPGRPSPRSSRSTRSTPTSGCRSRPWPTLQAGQEVRLRTDTFPDATWDGALTTINPEVDPATRNVLVRATFAEPGRPAPPGHVRQASRSWPRSGSRWWSSRPPPSSTRPTATRSSCSSRRPPRAASRPGSRRPPALRAARRAARRPRGGGLRPQGRRDGGQRAAPSSCATGRRWWCTTTRRPSAEAAPQAGGPLSRARGTAMKLHRSLHPPAGHRGGGQPGHRHRRAAGHPLAQRAPVPAQRERRHHRHHRLRRRQRRAGARLHHHAARAGHRRRRRHRLHRVAEPAERLDHPGPPAARLRRHPGPGRDQLQGGPGARRPAARGPGPGHQHRVGRQPVRLGLPQLLLGVPASRTRSPTTWCGWSSRGSPPCRACSGPTSSAARTFAMRIWLKPDRMAALDVSARPRSARRWPPTTTWRRWARPRARWCRST